MHKLLIGLLPNARRTQREQERVRRDLEQETQREEHVDRLVEQLVVARRRNHFGEGARRAMERKARH